MLAQFGILGALYDRVAHGHARPRVGLLSNGAEESKGTALTREAHPLLAAAAAHPDAGFEFIGYVEGNDLFAGGIDVVATDGFTGNVALKLAEGLAEALYRMAAVHLPDTAALRRKVDYREHGGALLGGVDGVVVICHGRSDGRAIEMAIRAAAREVDGGLVDGLRAAFTRHAKLWDKEAE
jgi:glycerol-3-phosphate acyltransferase PlsX